jgi:hypothetical protein
MFGTLKKPAPKPTRAEFVARLDSLIADYRDCGDRALAEILERRAQALRMHYATTAPIV